MKSNKKGKKNKRNKNGAEFSGLDQDEYFYFIVGYTDGGTPYGITWEEHEAGQSHGIYTVVSEGGLPLKELKLTRIQFQNLVEAYDNHVDELESYLDIDTGDVVHISSYNQDEEAMELNEVIDEGDNETFFRIPHRDSYEGYMDMEEFVATVSNEKLRVRLLNVLIGGRRMFRRFKDTLASDGLELRRYYDFVESRNRERVLQWLESINVKVTGIE
ncbi:UPF0158 family protein [Paenibacillus sp. TRM 82003]|nr:UPF0158 family protein [Paenibacillus sp. TRM 82003]